MMSIDARVLFALTDAASFLGAHKRFMVDDQLLMKSGGWDYNNPKLLTNQIKFLLEKIDPAELSEEDTVWYFETLWMWYHHAVSCAIRLRDLDAARQYATHALELQRDDHPNKITRLLWFLVHGQIDSAKAWAEAIKDPVEHQSAKEYIEEYCLGASA